MHYMQIRCPVSSQNKPQVKSRNMMILQNHSLDQDKSFQKLLKFRTFLCLPCTLQLNMVCLHVIVTLEIFKKTVKRLIYPLLLAICKHFTVCTCSKPDDLSLSVLKTSCWLLMCCTSKMSLQSPDLMSFT